MCRSAKWLLLVLPILYVATMARTPVLGDPSEYTYVAYVMGIAHPPGYALMTLISKLFQLFILTCNTFIKL